MGNEERVLERKRAVAVVGLELIKTMLRLPPGVHLEHILMDDGDRFTGCCKLILVGDDLPEECWTKGVPVRVGLRYEQTGGQIDDVEAVLPVLKAGQEYQPRPPLDMGVGQG